MSDVYRFEAYDISGQRIRGSEQAANHAAALSALQSRGLLVVGLNRQSSSSVPAHTRSNHKQLLDVTRALAALIPTGLPVSRALTAARDVAEGPMVSIIDAVRLDVERGQALATALDAQKPVFSSMYSGLVRAGERSGDLGSAFSTLAKQLEREDALRAKLLSASIYPLLLAVGGGAAILVLLFLVIPRFGQLLQDTGMALPVTTASLLTFSQGLQRFWPILVIATAALIGLAIWGRVTPDGQRATSRLLLHLPLIRVFRRNAIAARFARLLGVLVGGGAPILSALDDTITAITDPTARDETTRIRDQVREGASLRKAISTSQHFPPLLSQLVSVGEESGRLAEFLTKSADLLEERTERALQRIVAAAEPVMIIFFGGIVGFVALSLLQAVYGVNAAVSR